jgi:hypothetical protein
MINKEESACYVHKKYINNDNNIDSSSTTIISEADKSEKDNLFKERFKYIVNKVLLINRIKRFLKNNSDDKYDVVDVADDLKIVNYENSDLNIYSKIIPKIKKNNKKIINCILLNDNKVKPSSTSTNTILKSDKLDYEAIAHYEAENRKVAIDKEMKKINKVQNDLINYYRDKKLNLNPIIDYFIQNKKQIKELKESISLPMEPYDIMEIQDRFYKFLRKQLKKEIPEGKYNDCMDIISCLNSGRKWRKMVF